MSNLDINDFLNMSAVLTGFSAKALAPGLDPVDMKSTYIKVWAERVALETSDSNLPANILSQYVALSTQSPKLTDQQIGEALLDEKRNSLCFVMACRQLIYLWYMGAWPTVDEDRSQTETRGFTSFEVISTDSYTSGLVWQVMQSHPMGDSNYRYGYWSTKPADLSDYTGNKES